MWFELGVWFVTIFGSGVLDPAYTGSQEPTVKFLRVLQARY